MLRPETPLIPPFGKCRICGDRWMYNNDEMCQRCSTLLAEGNEDGRVHDTVA